ncbi:BT_3044 domain-containing protein [Bacteroides thetaiotaomicron]|nr:DUF4361 domain-containing protein [Bacteroides thetaiotaomicron]MCS2207871.1 DUF4361 domain-containing protein [Bacteroides thetaiotaomicron]
MQVQENEPLVKSEIVTYAIDDETIFFYAGTIDEADRTVETTKS